MLRCTLLATAVLISLTGLALGIESNQESALAATFTPVAQTRTVSGSAYAQDLDGTANDADSDSAADFGPFDSAVSAQATVANALGSGGGIQSSTILGTSLNASGSSFANGESYDFDSYGEGSGTSYLSVTFAVSAETDYTLTGEIAAFDGGSTELTLRDGLGALIFSESASGPSDMIPIDDAGPMAAGQYTLEIDSGGSAFGDLFSFGYASTEYDVALRIGSSGPGGEVPDGRDVAGTPLRVETLGGGALRLTWGASCREADVNYGVYEGLLGDRDSFAPATCTTSGGLQHDVTPTNVDASFLVVPNDGSTEGFYGDDSDGLARPPGASACFPQSLGEPVCP